VERKAFNQSR
jgi:hypothetical protein